MPTNFNITGFRDAVGSAGRVTVHHRNMRKMLLVAIDYELEPLSSPPSDPLPPSPSAVDELGDYNYCFDDGEVAVAMGQEAAAGDNETVATPTASALASSADGLERLDGATEPLKGASWLDTLLTKASRGPKFDHHHQQQQQQQQQRYQQQEQAEERRQAPEGTSTKQAAAAEFLGILHAKLPTAHGQPRPEPEAEVVDRSGSGSRGGVAESPKASSGAMVRARWRLKELLGLDTSDDGEANLDAGEASESYPTSSTNNSTNNTNGDAATCALPNPAKGCSTDDGGCGKGLGGGVAVTTPSSQGIEAAAVWSKTEERAGVAAKTAIGVPREGESATKGPRRRLKEILGLKL